MASPLPLVAGLLVLAAIAVGFAVLSREVRTSAPVTPPLPPSALQVIGVTDTRVYLSWQDNSNVEDAFLVYQIGLSQPVARTSRNVIAAAVDGLHCGTTYQFHIAASNSAGQALSDVVTIATGICGASSDQSCSSGTGAFTPGATPLPETVVPSPANDTPTRAASPQAATPNTLVPVPTPAGASLATKLSVPDGYNVHVTPSGCLPNGACPLGEPAANYYWSPTRTAVICSNQSAWTLQHEACHAHQHLTILDTSGQDPAAPYDLHKWSATTEARDWNARVTTAWPAYGQWSSEPSPHTSLEDFAITCGLYFSDPRTLNDLDTQRFHAIADAFQ